MVRLKLPARRRELATDAPGDPGPGNPPIDDRVLASGALQREQQKEREAAAPVVARRAMNVFEEAIEELGPPMPPARMPVAVQSSDLRGSARRLVCRDRAKMKSANTWDTFAAHSGSLKETRNYRRRQRSKSAWPNTEKKTRSAFSRAFKEYGEYGAEFQALFNRQPTVSEDEKNTQKIVDRYMPELYVTDTLPSYKCMARALTLDENEQLRRNRNDIDKARNGEEGDHRHFDTSFKWGEGELNNLARMIGPPMYTNATVAYNNLGPEYNDFMNEERRAILSTIRGATARLGRKEVRIDDLEEQERIDVLAEYAPLFEDEKRDDLVLAPVESVVVHDADPNGKPKEQRSCLGTPETNFDNPDARDPQSDAITGGNDAVRKRDEDAKDFLDERVPPLDDDGKIDKKGPKDVAKEKLNKGGIIYKEVKALADENGCKPCKVWEFPKDGFKPGNGYYQAIRRVLEVNNQMGNQGSRGTSGKEKKSTLDWPYLDSFMNDPFIRFYTVTGEKGKTEKTEYVLDALYWKYNPGASPARSKWNLLQTELLRCYPEKMPEDSNRLNSILDFICWWDVNITRRKEIVLGKRGLESQSLADKAKDSRIYLALCCPNCQSGKFPDEPLSLFRLRSNLHARVGMIRKYMENLKDAIDQDVLNGEPKNSILWNYKAGTDPVANAAVRKELYEGWKRLNPLQ